MKKKIKDLTIQEQIDICTKYSIHPCFDCPLCNSICGKIPYIIKCKEDIEKEIDV